MLVILLCAFLLVYKAFSVISILVFLVLHHFISVRYQVFKLKLHLIVFILIIVILLCKFFYLTLIFIFKKKSFLQIVCGLIILRCHINFCYV